MKAALLLLISQSFNVIYAQSGDCAQLESNKCSSCLQIPGCLWCSDVDYSGARCNTLEEHKESRCNQTVDGDPNEKPTLETVALTERNQISPKSVSSKIRVGVPLEFNIEVEPAANYPVDFYILMDLSASMDDDLNNLKKLALNISAKLGELTTRHRLAFGSFVDKVVPPYVKEEKVGKAYRDGKDKPYDYKHVLDFTEKAEEFRAKVDKQVSSGNRDIPEGTFDALMQVAACEEELKWNPADKTRRMVLIATDATFHMAGEGKLGGIVHPNDEKCWLRKDGDVRLYAKSLELDYPTVNQVYQRLKKSDIQPIFAVSGEGVYSVYETIANQWADIGATWGRLDGDSKNIIQLIQESYDKITSTVRLSPSTTPEDVEIKIKRNCVSAAGAPENECQNVKPGVKVSFDVSVTATSCKLNKTEFKLTAAGFGTVDINLDIICSCDCENKRIENSSNCNFNGTLVCGSCQCKTGRSGRNCQCDAAKFTNNDPSLCKMTNETGTLVCEGNGECDCGVCKCNLIPGQTVKYYGEFCQCSNFNCDQSDNLVCGGPKKGECKCGTCHCTSGFKGSNCGEVDCSLYMDRCLTGKEGEPRVNCSNHGECNCGVCKCDTFYEGSHCDKCPSCAGRCGDYQQCVLCKVFGDTPANATLCQNCTEIEKLASLSELQALGYPTTCQETDDEGCTYYYTYLERDNVTKVFAVENKDCPEGPDVLVIVLAVIGGIVGIGIILLILWKLLTAMVDRREYQKFEQDRAKSKWHREKNPLYKPATSTVQNPTFVGSKS